MKVFVYFNLHKKCWSVRALSGIHRGLVVAHAEEVVLSNVKPKVSEAGRQRVLREKSKNVHAGLAGELVFLGKVITLRKGPIETKPSEFDLGGLAGDQISYNPYISAHFHSKNRPELCLDRADKVLMNDQRLVFAYGAKFWQMERQHRMTDKADKDTGAGKKRIGMLPNLQVPDDFNEMCKDEIEALFSGNEDVTAPLPNETKRDNDKK